MPDQEQTDARAERAVRLVGGKLATWLVGAVFLALLGGVGTALGWVSSTSSDVKLLRQSDATQAAAIATLQAEVAQHERDDAARAKECANGRRDIDVSIAGLNATLAGLEKQLDALFRKLDKL